MEGGHHPIWGYFFRENETKPTTQRMLAALPVFEGLKKRDLVLVERILHDRRYKNGETVFVQEEPGAAMYIVQEGAVTILRDGNRLALLEPGSFFGEMALLEDAPRSATAEAAGETLLLALSQPDLMALLERHPKIGARIFHNLGRMMSRRLRMANDNLETLRQSAAG